jgi:hypothetical protein
LLDDSDDVDACSDAGMGLEKARELAEELQIFAELLAQVWTLHLHHDVAAVA